MPGRISPANRFGLDYRQEAARLGPPPVPIIDAHTHIAGGAAPPIYDEVRRLFGVRLSYSMTQLSHAPIVEDALGDTVRFIAFPSFGDPDRAHAFRQGFLDTIEKFRTRHNSRILKIWSSPRMRDIFTGADATDVVEIDSPWRVRACELGTELGMMFMVHIADPDTWFATKYSDAARYRTKREQYEGLERMLDRFTNPWIAAHMGGWPEDLAFLDAMLTRHPNLYIDTSATKWVVRELSRHPAADVVAFFTKWRGRLLFGSDIVVTDDHVSPRKVTTSPMADLADSPEAAFELYASRYYALRTMFETGYDAESPIADPDLAMIDPSKYDAMSAPRLQGLKFQPNLLEELYANAATGLVEKWIAEHP